MKLNFDEIVSFFNNLVKYNFFTDIEDFKKYIKKTEQDYLLEDSVSCVNFNRMSVRGRVLLCRFRGGASGLRAQTGKWEKVMGMGLLYEERYCKLCYQDVESVEHVLTSCNVYDKERKELIGCFPSPRAW